MNTTLFLKLSNQAQQAVKESEGRYQRLLGSVTDYVYSVTVDQGRAVATSHGPGCEAVTGFTLGEFEADSFLWYRMIYNEDRPAVTAQAERVVRGETPSPLEHRIVRKDGRIRWIRNTPVPQKDDGGRLISYDGLISDITERKRAEEFLAVEHAVTVELAGASSLDEALTRILKSICATFRCFQWDLAAFWGVDVKANLLRCGEIWCSSSTQAKEFAAVSRKLPLAPGIGVPGQVWASGEPAWIPDLLKAETKCSRVPYARTADLHGTCGFPVRSGQQCLGVIELFSRQIQPPDPDMMRMLMVLGAQIGQFIERKTLEEQHRLGQAQLQAILDNSPALIHVKDAQGRYILVNRRFEQILHLSREEIIGKSPRDLFPQETANAFLNHDQKVLATLTPMEFEETVPGDGEPRSYLSVKFPFLHAPGGAYALCGISTDITERKQAEAVLQRSTEEIRDLYNNAPCGYHSLDKDGVFLRVNDTELKWLGYSREEFLGKMRFSDLLTPEGLEGFHENFPLLKQRGWVSNLEFKLVRKDGTTLAALLSATAVKDASGNYVMSRSTIFDITERKRADLELQRSYQAQEVLNALLAISLQDISLKETLQQVIDRILAVPWLSVEAKGAIFVVEADSLVLALKAHRNVSASLETDCALVPFGRCLCGRAAASGEIEFAGHVDDRHETHYEGMTPHGHYCIPIVSAGKVLGVICLYLKENHRREPKEDEFLNAVANVVGGVIQRKQAEEQLKQALAHLTTAHEELKAIHQELKGAELQLIQAAKLESVGTLAAGVAHEVKNPLQTILLGLDYLAGNLPAPNENTRLVLSDMREAVTRALAIVQELLRLSAQRDLELKNEDLNLLLERSLLLLRNELAASQISVQRRLGAGLPPVKIDRGKMEQVFVNLFLNALQAMPRGGVLTVTSRVGRFDRDLNVMASARLQFHHGDPVVVVEVQDNGSGIAEAHLPRIFDPFFTTKPVGVGTGLGLPVVKNIVELHGGAIGIKNAPGGGVLVTMVLKAEPEALQEERPIPANGAGSICPSLPIGGTTNHRL